MLFSENVNLFNQGSWT